MINQTEIVECMEYLHEGAFRKAYIFGKNKEFVFKLPHSEQTISHNLAEIEGWLNIPKSIKYLFVPVLDYDKKGKWLTMPRVLCLELPEGKRAELVESLKNILRLKGYYCNDLHSLNVGIKNNKPVILDYGMGYHKL